MKAGSFNLNDYLERLHEEKEASSKVPVEGIIIPDENKKTFNWLKKEFQKGKTEVKVEIKMGGQKFEPGYDLQTNLKSVKDFKPGMFGDVKTSDTEGSKKKEEGQNGEGKPAGTGKAVPGKKEPKKGVVVKGAEAEEKEEGEEHEEKEEHEEHEEKEKSKKKLHEGLSIVQEGEQNLEPEALAYINSLPFTRKPGLEDLNYAKKIQVDPQLEAILSLLPVVDFDTYEDLLEDFGDDFPYKRFFIANIKEDDGVSFLVRPDGYSYARYIAELI
jgi:hypothetical protein